MEVKLIAHTPEPERLIGAIAKSTRDPRPFADLLKEDNAAILKKVLEMGHHSVLEHASFTFYINGISRVCSHQLVRHRIASYTQQSQRAVDLSGADFIKPRTLANEDLFQEVVERARRAYAEFLGRGIPKEDARYLLPSAVATSLVLTMNARELLHFFSLRCCMRAQWEIRELAYRMLAEVRKVAPLIFAEAGPPCKRGSCPEGWAECPLFPSRRD